MIKIRFRNFPSDGAYLQFVELVEISTNDQVTVIQDNKAVVDLEITGPYCNEPDKYLTPLTKRLKRGSYILFTHGAHLSRRDLSTGIQPLKTAKKNIWYSGENERPPQGLWDGYLAFDTNLPNDRSAYLPLWFITSTDLFKSTKQTYWGNKVPSINQLLDGRSYKKSKKRFTSAFLGKNYSMRLHAIEILSKIGRVDVFGESVRNKIHVPTLVAQKYRFVMCFENDIYPGYVTEKPFEAYLSGTIPLYYGHDVMNYLNPRAIINLLDFKSIVKWANYVNRVENNENLYKKIYEQPLLIQKPSLDPAIKLIQKVLC